MAQAGKGAGTSGQAKGNRRKNGGSTEKGVRGKPVRHGTTVSVQAAAGSTTDGIAIPERRANPDVFARAAGSGSTTRFTTATAPVSCTSRTANAIYRTAANTIRTIYYFRTTSATGSATGSSTTARDPVSSTGTDATGTDRRKAMDATGSATATVCTGTGGRKNL